MEKSTLNIYVNHETVWIIGNGPSQKKWKLKELDGFTYGCNNLYRHFTPNILLAVDPGAIFEIVDSGYKGQCRFSDWNLMLREYDKKYVEHFLEQEVFRDYKIMYAGNALKVTYMGPYKGSAGAHEAIATYAETNGKEFVGPPWEVYVNDPSKEPDPNKYITEVYYPVN